MGKREDKVRIQAILQAIIEPFSSEDMSFLTVEQKLILALQPEQYPIYRRQLKRSMPVYGLWWLDAEQFAQFASTQYADAKIIKTGQDPDRVLTTKTFCGGGFCYIREHEDRVDLEALASTNRWCPIKKKRLGMFYEWLTVTVTRDTFDKLENYLGNRDEGWRHHRDD